MFGRLFPKQMDNHYQGQQSAIWLLVPVLLLKLAMGFNVAGLNPWISNQYIARTADGIRLDTFGVEAASTVMFMFASWGLILFVLSLFGLIVVIRYRAMIPLLYLLLLTEQLGRTGIIALANPIVKAVKPDQPSFGFLLNWGLVAVLVVGLASSLGRRSASKSEGDGMT